MDNLILKYLVQSTLWLAGLYGFYWLWLRRETFFQLNRVFILVAILFSILAPFVKIPVAAPVFALSVVRPSAIEPVAVTLATAQITRPEAEVFPWQTLLFSIYAIGASVYFFIFAWRLVRLWQLSRQSPIEKKEGYCLIRISNNNLPVFSFFQWLFWNEDMTLTETERRQIVAHELVHIRQKHSCDVVLLELLTVVFWFNPVLYLFKREMRLVHEFLADQAGVQMTSTTSYARLIHKQILYRTHPYLVQSFHSSYSKLRIAMLQQPHSSRKRFAKYIAIALAAICVMVVTAPKTTLAQVTSSQKSVGKVVVTGKVLDADSHKPLERATVIVTGTNTGSVTNEKGEYRLELDNAPASLAVSYVGYVTVEVPYVAKQQLVVELPREIFGMEQIVVIGYKNPAANGQPVTKPEPLTPPQPTDLSQPRTPSDATNIVEQLPEFPGGMQALYKYLGQNIRYPKEAKEKNIQGDVFVRMVISENGQVGDVTVAKSTAPELNSEATRIVKEMPRWQPAQQNQKNVAVSYVLPIRFSLE